VTFGSCNEILLIKALQSAGLTEKDVQMVNMDPDTAGSALKAGSIDAAATWEPWISQLIGAQNANIIFSSKDAPNIIIDCTAVRKDLSPEKTAAIKKFIAIMNRGNELAIAHPEEAAKLISGKLGLPEADIVAMLKTVKLYGAEENKALLGGGVLPAANEVVKLFKDKGVIESDLSLDNVFSPSLLP
jgi:NitT/TauT family transport system substrate-binding protein